MTDVITLPRGELAAYQNAVERGKAEVAQLEMERDQALADRDQAIRSRDAERVARQRADTVIATLREWRVGDVSGSSLTIALAQYDAALRNVELFPPPAADSGVERTAQRAIVGRLKRSSEDGRP